MAASTKRRTAAAIANVAGETPGRVVDKGGVAMAPATGRDPELGDAEGGWAGASPGIPDLAGAGLAV